VQDVARATHHEEPGGDGGELTDRQRADPTLGGERRGCDQRGVTFT
jgi:hypothetical protein